MKRACSRTAVLVAVAGAAGLAAAQEPDGAAVFQARCAVCHTGAENTRAPAPDVLKLRSPEAILDTLTVGGMRAQGSRLSGPERRAVAEFITGKKMGGDPTGATSGRCATDTRWREALSGPSWNGWSPTVANTRFQPAREAGLTAEQVPRLILRWAFGFPDASAAWAPPTLVGGRVFVGSQNGTVYSLDARTGCIHWVFSAAGGVRTALTLGRREGGGVAAYFGDTSANAYALDAATGRLLWKRKVEDHPMARITGSPTLYKDRLYVPLSSYEESQGASPQYECCSFRGSLVALEVTTGEVAWKTYMVADAPQPRGKSTAGATLYGPSGSAIWSAPTIDPRRGLVYVGTGNTYSGPPQPSSDAVVALTLATGKIRWMRQLTPADVFLSGCRTGSSNPNCPDENGPDFDFGNAPILTRRPGPGGKEMIVIGQKSGVGFALDPDKDGEVLWQYRAGEGGALGGLEWGSAVDADKAYFPVSDITRPNPGGLHAVTLATGARAWYAPPAPVKCGTGRGCNAAQTAAVTVIPGVVFSGSNDGAMRAYSTKDGSVLWEFDTNREFTTTNGVAARGASMQGPGPIVAGGLVVFNSGYGAFGGRPGNVLLAFSAGGPSPAPSHSTSSK